ncbi:isocitrate lyase/PEP mutase family protein [Paenibacillus sp. Z6-24]
MTTQQEQPQTSQQRQAKLFHELHIKGTPLLLVNVWDAGNTAIVESAGARAIATGSWSVAAAHGYGDNEELPLDLVIANIERIKRQTNLPLSIDVEGGYGASPQEVAATIRRVIAAGAVGINMEDQKMGENRLYSIQQQCERIAAARQAADEAGVSLFINARTDIFLQMDSSLPESGRREAIEEVLQRAEAYAKAGASGLFVPGLSDLSLIETVCARSELPVNIMVTDHESSVQELAALGVSRISYGPRPYQEAMYRLRQLASSIFQQT